MAKDQDNIHVYGSDDDTVWLAPLGTTLPTDLGELAPAFIDVGYISEDGLALERQADVQEFRAHQGAKVVRKKVTASGKKINFAALEDNEITDQLGGDLVSTVTADGVTTQVISDSSKVTVWAAVIDLFDNEVHVRRVIPRYEVVVTGTEEFSNSAMTAKSCEGTIIGNQTKITGPVA